MQNGYTLRSFKLKQDETIVRGNGLFLFTNKGKKYLDATSGLTGTSILGWGNKKIEDAINDQLKKIALIDYKYFIDANREKVSKKILTGFSEKLNKFYFVGGSGGEACEASMKLAFLYQIAKGKKKKKNGLYLENSPIMDLALMRLRSAIERILIFIKIFFQALEVKLMNTIILEEEKKMKQSMSIPPDHATNLKKKFYK